MEMESVDQGTVDQSGLCHLSPQSDCSNGKSQDIEEINPQEISCTALEMGVAKEEMDTSVPENISVSDLNEEVEPQEKSTAEMGMGVTKEEMDTSVSENTAISDLNEEIEPQEKSTAEMGMEVTKEEMDTSVPENTSKPDLNVNVEVNTISPSPSTASPVTDERNEEGPVEQKNEDLRLEGAAADAETQSPSLQLTEGGSDETETANPLPTEEETTTGSSYYYWNYEIISKSSPKCLIRTGSEEFHTAKDKKLAKFMKGCKWAPDGSCLLSSSDDDNLRLFNYPSCCSSIQDWKCEDLSENLEQWSSALKVKEGGLIYDYCWYPGMSSMDPVTSCFLSTSSEAPIHLWDAFTGKLRASYQPFNHLEQLVSAYSIAFDPTGETIYSGYDKCIRLFNITRPGKVCTERVLKQPETELSQHGIIANICVNPTMKSFYAVGSFDKTIGLYYEDGSVICLLQGHTGGITHMKFSSDGMKLFSGGRNDNRLICWDMRNMGEPYKMFDRVVSTHQRIYFDVTLDDRYLVTGGTDGVVKIWDDKIEGTEPCCIFKANSDCVNGVSWNPYAPVLATTSGQRHFYEIASDSDEEEMFIKSKASRDRSCDIKLWKMT